MQAISYLAGQGERGFSFAEMVIVICVIGILAAILIPTITGVVQGTQATTAASNLDLLNQAVLKYNHANTNYVSTVDSSANDELQIFQMLQARNTNLVGSPFMSATMGVAASSDTKTYRAVWNGRMFEEASLGTNGAGLNLLEMKESGTSH